MKIGDMANKFGISHRSLHYWESVDIIKSSRSDNGYRYYDEENQRKISQILVLRKLRLPLKQIIMVLESTNSVDIIEALQQNLSEVDDEITALSTIRSILDSFITRLNENMMIDLKVNLLDDSTILEIADSLTLTRPVLKEEKTGEDLAMANEKLSKLTDRDVRIVYLPPATVAAAHCVGGPAEWSTSDLIREFIKSSDLVNQKPDFRHYGFNHPNGSQPDGSDHGYERWITIPDNMEVPAPLVKKHFKGGLYAAHMIPIGAFDEWGLLWDWAHNNQKYDANIDDDGRECMNGLIEEHLNVIHNYMLSNEGLDEVLQLDLLCPIKEKNPQ